MACKLAIQCDLIFRFLKCALPEDTINVDLKGHTLKRTHTFKKVYKSQTSRCSPWGGEVKPYSTLRRKMKEFMHWRQATTAPMKIKLTDQSPKKLPGKEI